MHRAKTKLDRLGPEDEGHNRRQSGEGLWLTSAKFKLVDACNLRCFMCDYWKGKREGELDTSEVKGVISGLRELGCEKIHFTGGELFLRKDVVEIFRHTARLGIRINLTTNGTRGTKEQWRELLRLPVRSVTLSVDGPTAKVHDQIRGRKGAFKLTLRTLDRLLASRGKKTRVRVNTVVHRGNVQAVGEIAHLWRERPLDGWLLIPIDPKSHGEGALSRQDIETYNARTAPILAETVKIEGFDPYVFGRTEKDIDYAARGQWARGYYERHRCHVPDFHTLINSRGDVFPCCMAHQNVAPLGNIRDRSIGAIFKGESYGSFRLTMAAQRLAVCHRCDDFSAENRAINDLLDGWKKR